MMTYDEAAKELSVPRGTLVRRIAENNKRAETDEDTAAIKPDHIVDHGHYKKFYFTQETVEKMQKMLKGTIKGRPPKPKGETV